MTRVFIPGSFDPPTLGHFDIFMKCAITFDEVVIGIGSNPAKESLLPAEERKRMILTHMMQNTNLRNMYVTIYYGLTIKEAKAERCGLIVRGVRGVTDFLEEMNMAQINYAMEDIPTVFMPTDSKFNATSSSMVKQLFKLGGNWQDYVSPIVAEAMLRSENSK